MPRTKGSKNLTPQQLRDKAKVLRKIAREKEKLYKLRKERTKMEEKLFDTYGLESAKKVLDELRQLVLPCCRGPHIPELGTEDHPVILDSDKTELTQALVTLRNILMRNHMWEDDKMYIMFPQTYELLIKTVFGSDCLSKADYHDPNTERDSIFGMTIVYNQVAEPKYQYMVIAGHLSLLECICSKYMHIKTHYQTEPRHLQSQVLAYWDFTGYQLG